MRQHVRYDVPDETGETRRDRNARFGFSHVSPDIVIPPGGAHLWNMYFDLSSGLRRVRDGVCEPIPPSDFMAYCQLNHLIVKPVEYAILRQMDAAYCAETNTELAAYRERLREQSERGGK